MLNQNEERLQKALARAGIASRRASEDLIAAGRVKVNGKIVTELGTKINPARDRVTVDDAPVAVRPSAAPAKVYIMLHKPAGYLSTVSDPQGRPTIMDLVETEGRLYPVGRLDADTEGLLLLTNDGAFAHALSHPSFGVEKEYVALLDGIVAMKDLVALRDGVAIRVEDAETGEHVRYTARAVKAELIRNEGSNTLVRFILKEGKKRQIRLMAEAIEHPVIDLKRVRFGPLKLADLPSGQHRTLTKVEVQALLDSARAPKETKPVAAKAAPARSQTPTPTAPVTGRGRRPFPPQPQSNKPFERKEGPFRSTTGDRKEAPFRNVSGDRKEAHFRGTTGGKSKLRRPPK